MNEEESAYRDTMAINIRSITFCVHQTTVHSSMMIEYKLKCNQCHGHNTISD